MRAVGGEVLVEDGLGLGEQPRAHAGERLPPRASSAVRRIRSSAQKRLTAVGRVGARPLTRDVEIGQQRVERRRPALARGQHDAEGRRHADGGRAPHDQRADRVGHVLPAPVLALQLLDRAAASGRAARAGRPAQRTGAITDSDRSAPSCRRPDVAALVDRRRPARELKLPPCSSRPSSRSRPERSAVEPVARPCRASNGRSAKPQP